MPRISENAKKIFDLFWYKFEIEQSKEIIKELINPTDIIFSKIWLAFYYFTFLKIDLGLTQLKDAEEINTSHPDNFASFFMNTLYFYHYFGFNYLYPLISLERVNHYFNKLESDYNQIDFSDDWEKYVCEGWYYFFKGAYTQKIENDIDQGIIYLKKSKENLRLVPEDGEYLSKSLGNLNLAFFQRVTGRFEESEKNYQIAYQETKKYDNLWQGTSLFNLTLMNIQKGDYKKALGFIEEFGRVCKKFNYNSGIPYYLGVKGDLFYEEGKYNEALELYKESLMNRKKLGNPIEIVKGYLDIFFICHQKYKITKEKEDFKKAEDIFIEIKKIHEQNPDDRTITNYANYTEARLLKYGNINKKAKSLLLFDELIKIWPRHFEMVIEYLELLFEDYMISEDQETLGKIDIIMKQAYDYTLSYNAMYSFVGYQIMLAQYQFYIKDDVDSAFKILTDAKEKISNVHVERYTSQIENQLINFRNERKKWERVDYSVKERIEKSEFRKYIQDVLKSKIV